MTNTIQFTQGATAVLNLFATNGNGDPVDLTGAVFTTQVKGPNGEIATFDNSQHAIVGSAANGNFTLTLSTDDTAECGLGRNKDIITKVVQGASINYYRGISILEVFPPEPNQ